MKNYISSPGKTIEVLSEYNIRLRKSLGQNYIIDTNSVKKMVSLAQVTREDVILEIGCGIGSLTEVLLEKEADAGDEENEKRALLWLETGITVLTLHLAVHYLVQWPQTGISHEFGHLDGLAGVEPPPSGTR